MLSAQKILSDFYGAAIKVRDLFRVFRSGGLTQEFVETQLKTENGEEENSTRRAISERNPEACSAVRRWCEDFVREPWNRPQSSVQLKYGVFLR